MKTILIILLSFGIATTALAQSEMLTASGLKIGDKCPDFNIDNVLNYKSTSVHLSDFKGKLVIIDFWATWCGPCLKALPELDSMQKKFSDKIQIITVTYQTKQTVEEFLTKTPDEKIKRMGLPIVYGDKLLNNYFKHQLIPHEVWIDGNGVIKYFTDAEQVKTENIEAVINKLSVPIKSKNDKRLNMNKPLLMGAIDTGLVDIQYSSAFTGDVKGLPSAVGYRQVGNIQKVIATNHIIQNLYKSAFGQMSAYFQNNNRIRLELKDSTALFWYWLGRDIKKLNRDSLYKKFSFCYELEVSKDMPKETMYKIMQDDLNRFFGIRFAVRATMEKRKVLCWVAKRITNNDNLASKNDSTYIEGNKFGLHLRNEPLDLLFQNISYAMSDTTPPLINDTHYDKNVDMDVNCSLTNISQLRRALQPYGIDIVSEEREIDMIIIRDHQPYVFK